MRSGGWRASAVGALGGALLAFAGVAPAARADDARGCGAVGRGEAPLRVSVSGMRTTAGNITITIYPDEASHFLDGRYKVARQRVRVSLPTTGACFVLAAPGTYAVALFQDEHDDGHLETNSLGIPTEGFGFSNNPTLYLGPPDLSRVRFALQPGGADIAIRMKYY